MAYRRIVVGSDGSGRAGQAVREAAHLAAKVRARLIVVTAFGLDRHTDRDGGEATAAEAIAVAPAQGASDVHVLTDEGPPPEVLLRAVETHGADLVVIGSKGMTDPSRFRLGAVANTISHDAPCDVLIIHTAPEA